MAHYKLNITYKRHCEERSNLFERLSRPHEIASFLAMTGYYVELPVFNTCML